MPLILGVKRGTNEWYPIELDDDLNLIVQSPDASYVNEGKVFIASYNYVLGGAMTANMFITTGNDTWGMKVQVVTGGWATAVLCEDVDAPVAGTGVAVRSLNRPSPFVPEPDLIGNLDIEANALTFVCGTQLCEAFTGACEGIVLGSPSEMWVLNPSSIYGIEVTDISLIANVVSIIVTFYLLEEA